MSSDILERVLRHCRYWVTFIGPRRVVAMVSGTMCCLVVAWFVLRPTPTPVDLALPHATAVSTTGQPISDVVVHVTGAVKHPGVYTVPARSRIVDALAAAGGALSAADLERINLAQTVADAEQIHIPRRATAVPRVTVAPRLRPRHRTSSTLPASSGSKLVNINTATSTQLEALTGVGPSLAKSIITYRTQKGPFTKIEDLLNVPGIGPSKLSAMRDEVSVS